MKIALIGAGQQGTSQGLAFARLDSVDAVVFCDTNSERKEQILAKAQMHDIDLSKLSFTQNLRDAVADADVIGLNTPSDVFGDLAAQVSQYAKEGATLYDNGSGKVKAIADIEAGLGDNSKQIHYFPAHFFVGRAGTGAGFANPDMYQGQTVAIMGDDTPEKTEFIDLIKKATGVKTVRTDLSPEDHDESLGLYSHHNTFAVTALMLAFPSVEINEKPIQIGRFLSSTRVAAHGTDGATFWGPIANDNADAIVTAANIFSKQLEDIRLSLITGNLSNRFEYASQYVRIIEADRKFEGLEGDQNDLNHLVGADEDARSELAVSHLAMPLIFAAASALVAYGYEMNDGQSFASIGNSSFHDSIRPMRDNPKKSAKFVESLGVSPVVECINRLISSHKQVINAIQNRDADSICGYIKDSHNIRAQLPDAPTEDELREEFIIG